MLSSNLYISCCFGVPHQQRFPAGPLSEGYLFSALPLQALPLANFFSALRYRIFPEPYFSRDLLFREFPVIYFSREMPHRKKTGLFTVSNDQVNILLIYKYYSHDQVKILLAYKYC